MFALKPFMMPVLYFCSVHYVFNRDRSIVRPVRRCHSDLGYVSQETINTDVVSSFRRPLNGRRKKLACGVRVVKRTPTVNSVVNHPSKLRAKVCKPALSDKQVCS